MDISKYIDNAQNLTISQLPEYAQLREKNIIRPLATHKRIRSAFPSVAQAQKTSNRWTCPPQRPTPETQLTKE
ncbi:MAG: hypothetical protein KTR25_06810 [Myxococcales bacterium]|nr:hypothetical protein [Myxococcales bacterium]